MSQLRRLPAFLVRILPLCCAGMAVLTAQPVDVVATLPDKDSAYLQEILQGALSQSPNMLQRNIELLKAEAGLSMAQSQRWPSLGGSSRWQNGTVSTTGSSSYTSSGFFYDITASYSLFKWGDVKNSIEIERLQQLVTQKNFAEAYRDLAGSLRVQFMQLVLKKHALATRTLMFEIMKRQHAESEKKLASGTLSPGEVASSQLGLDEAQLAFERDQAEFEASKRAFARTAGLASLDESRLPDSIPLPAYLEGQAQRLASEFRQRSGLESTPTAKATEFLVRQSELRYKIASTRLLPKLEARAGTRLENLTYLSGSNVSQSATRSQSIELTANWYIFDGFYTRAAKRSALAEKRSAELQRETYLKGIGERVDSLVGQVAFSARALGFAERRYEWSRAGLAYIEAEVKSGRSSEGQLIRSKIDVLENEQRAYSARADLYTRWSDLLAVLWLDPVLDRVPARYLNR